MRERVVGATVAVVAGLALSGCAGSPEQSPGSPEPQDGNQSVEAGSAESGDNGMTDEGRPCTGRDLTARYESGEVSPQGGSFTGVGFGGKPKVSATFTC